jgi:replicative DNA helicase
MERSNAAPMSLQQVCSALVDTFYRRKVYGLLEEAKTALLGTGELTSVLGSLEAELYQVQQQRSGCIKDWRVKSGDTAQEEYSGDIEEYLDAVDVSMKTGLLDLDAITLGLRPKTMSVWGGRPAMGKSALAGYLANAIALQNKPVVFFSMEMSALDLDLRRISLLTKIDGQKFLKKTLASHERQFSIEMWHWMRSSPLYYDGNPRSTPQSIRSTLRHYMATHGQIGAFVVDYLQLMGEGTGNRNNEVEQITRELKALSIEFNTHCICLSQISRGVESRQNKRPILSDLRDSGGIEQNADLIVFLYRDEYYNEDTIDRNVTELIVAKNRRSKVGTAKALTQLEYSNYENLAK